jgi:hypothetical protein
VWTAVSIVDSKIMTNGNVTKETTERIKNARKFY